MVRTIDGASIPGVDQELRVDRSSEGNRRRRPHLLVPIDGSSASVRTLEYAGSAHPEARITALYVRSPAHHRDRRSKYDESSRGYEGIERVRRKNHAERVTRVFDDAVDATAAHDVDLVLTTVDGEVTRRIVEYAASTDVDRIVIGRRNRSRLGRIMFGSVTTAVVRRATVPVTIVPNDGRPANRSENRRILAPSDGSPASTRGLAYAFETFPNAAFTVVHVIDPTEGYVESQGQSRKQAERWEEDVRNRTKYVLQRADWLADEYDVERSTERLSGTVSYEILDRTEGSDVDHIVVGRRNRSPVARSIRGGTSDAIVRRSRIPVTIVDESHAAARVRGADDGLRTDVDDDGGRG